MVQTAAGAVVSVSASLPATNDAAGFGALADFTAIGSLADAGEFGKEYNLVTFNPLATRQTQKFKGSYNDGSMAMQIGYDKSDAGQVKLAAGLASDNNYSFKVVLQDATIFYFQGKIMTSPKAVGTVDNIVMLSVTVEISEDIVEI